MQILQAENFTKTLLGVWTMKIIFFIPLIFFLVIGFSSAHAEIDFRAEVPKYAQIQRDMSFNIKAFDADDRSERDFIKRANVTIKIFDAWVPSYVIEEWSGKTSIRGYYAANELVTNHQYDDHNRYKMEITVSKGSQSTTKTFSFWTVEMNRR